MHPAFLCGVLLPSICSWNRRQAIPLTDAFSDVFQGSVLAGAAEFSAAGTLTGV